MGVTFEVSLFSPPTGKFDKQISSAVKTSWPNQSNFGKKYIQRAYSFFMLSERSLLIICVCWDIHYGGILSFLTLTSLEDTSFIK